MVGVLLTVCGWEQFTEQSTGDGLAASYHCQAHSEVDWHFRSAGMKIGVIRSTVFVNIAIGSTIGPSLILWVVNENDEQHSIGSRFLLGQIEGLIIHLVYCVREVLCDRTGY